MSRSRTLLLVDAGASPMEKLSQRLREMGQRVLRTKTIEQACAALSDPRFLIAAALIPPDLPVLDLGRALAALRSEGAEKTLRFVVVGERPDADERSQLRRAGVRIALWEPFDGHTLRFQVNRALADGAPPQSRRHAVRVPTNWPVRISTGKREKQGKIYCLSAHGAYLATSRPSLPRALVHFSVPLPSGDLRISGEVVMTNVPGNLVRRNLPIGMGVRFTGHARDAERSILEFTERRAQSLLV